MKKITTSRSISAAEKSETVGAGRWLRRAGVLGEYPISERTLTNWMRRGVLPYRKIGKVVLFDRREIEGAFARFRVAAVGDGE